MAAHGPWIELARRPYTCPQCAAVTHVAARPPMPHKKPVCRACGAYLERTILPEVEVPPDLRRGLDPAWRPVGQCYGRALLYVAMHDAPGLLLIHGKARPPGGPWRGRLMRHACVELTAEGAALHPVEQTFHDSEDYHAVMRTQELRRYRRGEALVIALAERSWGPWATEPGEVHPTPDDERDAARGVLALLARLGISS